MIYTDAQLKLKVQSFRRKPETEVVEFKEAKEDKSFKEQKSKKVTNLLQQIRKKWGNIS